MKTSTPTSIALSLSKTYADGTLLFTVNGDADTAVCVRPDGRLSQLCVPSDIRSELIATFKTGEKFYRYCYGHTDTFLDRAAMLAAAAS